MSREELALLEASEIRWSTTFGCWLDESEHPVTRFESTEDALDEACARAELGA